VQARTGPKKNQESRSPKSGSSDYAKLTQLVLDMKAEMGIVHKAITKAGILFVESPNEQKPREQAANG
jgi:hypothetical protein